MTTSFYAPPSAFHDNSLVLPEEEAHHAGRVLRLGAGDEIIVVDGEGGWHRVRLEHVARKQAAGTVLETQREVGEPPYHLTVGLALLKNRNRYETFLEKAVELGVSRIVPLLTERTEKSRLKAGRAEGILLAAMKQSGRSRLTELAEPMTPGEALAAFPADMALFCHERVGVGSGILEALSARPAASSFLALIGPEGGFSEAEVAAAAGSGAMPVSLGPRRLRAETAALAAATGVMLARLKPR